MKLCYFLKVCLIPGPKSFEISQQDLARACKTLLREISRVAPGYSESLIYVSQGRITQEGVQRLKDDFLTACKHEGDAVYYEEIKEEDNDVPKPSVN